MLHFYAAVGNYNAVLYFYEKSVPADGELLNDWILCGDIRHRTHKSTVDLFNYF